VKLLIADDEPPALVKLRRFLADIADVAIVAEAGDGAQALQLSRDVAADAILLDIQMPLLSGLEVATALPDGMLVVFVTAYDEHAVRAFELNAVDYLLKPYTRERLLACIERLRLRLRPEAREQQRVGLLGALHQIQPIAGHWMVPHRGALQRVALSEIECVEAADNYIELHTAAKSWLDRITLAAFLAHPAARGFLRVHRGHAVNLDRIVRIEPMGKGDAELTLTSGRRVRVSRRYRDALLKP
jgi:two-component system, LytTR family, response regulator